MLLYMPAAYCWSLPERGPSPGDRDCRFGFRSGRWVWFGGGEMGGEGTGVVGRDAPGSGNLFHSLLSRDGRYAELVAMCL